MEKENARKSVNEGNLKILELNQNNNKNRKASEGGDKKTVIDQKDEIYIQKIVAENDEITELQDQLQQIKKGDMKEADDKFAKMLVDVLSNDQLVQDDVLKEMVADMDKK